MGPTKLNHRSLKHTIQAPIVRIWAECSGFLALIEGHDSGGGAAGSEDYLRPLWWGP